MNNWLTAIEGIWQPGKQSLFIIIK